jgi:hypothetical protein
MRVIAYEICKVVMLFQLEEVVPLGGANDPDIVAKVRDRYRFTRGPDLKVEEIAKSGLKFEMGNFQFENANVRITDFALYRDGIVINATKTDAAEAFLDDIVSYMRKEFSFRDFITKPSRFFQSQIVVEFERSPAKLINSFEKITNSISARLQETYSMEIPMDFMRLDFDFDRIQSPAPALIQKVIIERRVGVPFNKQRYFSAAPLRTADHEALLREIEDLLPCP